MKNLKFALLLSVCFWVHQVCAQEHKYGTLSGSFETNSVFYMKDSKAGVVRPDDHFGSNNYLNLDYHLGKFSIGIRYEAYLPVLQGYSKSLDGGELVCKYVAFADKNLQIRVGDFYDQFGSGLIFRAYEGRSLGLNTSLEGVRLFYSFRDKIFVKGIYGRPRRFFDYASSWVRGLDLRFDVCELLNYDSKVNLLVEGSYVNRYEEYVGNQDIKSNVDAYSARLGLETGGFFLKGEDVGKAKDPAVYNNYFSKKGQAMLFEVGYAKKGLGVQANFRSLKWMTFRSSRDATVLEEDLNYLPTLTRQHTYALANLHPYATQGNGETGGQFDFYYNFRKNTALGGRTGWKLQANFSTYYNLKNGKMGSFGSNLLYRDFNVDLTKKWNRSWKSIFFYSMQDFDPVVIGKEQKQICSHVVVADVTYSWKRRFSLRMEGQHLWTKDDDKNWAALLVELGIAPSWSFFVSDMFNYGKTDTHYYSGGVSYSHSRTRIALNYGRNRAGYQCAGGVCREIPAYTGFNLTLTSSF